MTRPTHWKVVAFTAALTLSGLGMAGAATATARPSANDSDTSTSQSTRGTNIPRPVREGPARAGRVGPDTTTSQSGQAASGGHRGPVLLPRFPR